MATWKDHLQRAVDKLGSQENLAKAMKCSQAKVSWLLLTAETLKAEDAVAIDAATDGEVSKSELRPDLWPAEESRPPQRAAQVA